MLCTFLFTSHFIASHECACGSLSLSTQSYGKQMAWGTKHCTKWTFRQVQGFGGSDTWSHLFAFRRTLLSQQQMEGAPYPSLGSHLTALSLLLIYKCSVEIPDMRLSTDFWVPSMYPRVSIIEKLLTQSSPTYHTCAHSCVGVLSRQNAEGAHIHKSW